jgi:LytS/YehU family sensor histidine kinase
MWLNQYIFSNQLKHRLSRHLAFWLIFSLHFIIQSLLIGGPGEAKTFRPLPQSFQHFLYFFPIYVVSTYLFIEVLLPKYLYRRRWARFIISFLLLYSVSLISIYYAGIFYLHNAMNLPYSKIGMYNNRYHAIVNGMFISFMLFGIAAGIKFSKKWYLQQRENEKLAKQKLATELQLLKTSIHPRFLFHSLNTVQRHIDNSSDQSPALILQLSDLLSYILYEKDEPWAPLEKELEIISCYIHLEEKRFSDNRLFTIELPGKTEGKFILPFLLLTIVESSFEYFYESDQQEPLLKLTIRINENLLHFQLFFSRPADEKLDFHLIDEKLMSIKDQLQNQYPGLHQLQVTSDDEVISIELKLPLYSGDLINVKKSVMNELPETV